MGKHFSFVHCADLHLGEPFAGLRSGDVGPWTEAIGKATFQAFQNVVNLAIEKGADAILISGDVYNSEHHSLAAQMSFARELYRAAQAGIDTYIVHGNHDPEEAWQADIPLPPSVHVFGSSEVEGIPLLKDGEKVATVYGISYKTTHVKENLVKKFHREENDGFAIGMLHTELGNADSSYAPATVDDLKAAGMDYWALGHVHTRRVVNEKPYIIYPGNTQGLDITETGPRGCYLVDVGAFGTVTAEFHDTDIIRWLDMHVDISEFENQEQLIRDILRRRASLKELTNRPDIIRLVFTGRGPLHKIIESDEGKEYILQALNEKEQFRYIFAYFSQIKDDTRPAINLAERREMPDVMGEYLGAYDRIEKLAPEDRMAKLREILKNRTELARLPELYQFLTDDMILESFHDAEITGAEAIAAEDNDEDY